MIDSTSQALTVKDFGGALTLSDPLEVPQGYALIARNVEYVARQVQTRKGFKVASASFEVNAATSMFNWISSLGNYLVRFNPANRFLRIDNITTPASSALISIDLVGYAATHANAGARLYHAIFNTSGRGAIGGYVSSYQSSAFVSDVILPGPITYTPSAPTEPLAGFITAGLHRIGYRIEYRAGFTGRPCPDSGVGTPSTTTFVPISFTASGSKNCSITLNTTWPTGAVRVHIIMTPTDNLNRYLMVPGASAAVVGGAASSVTIAFSIADDDLLNNNPDEVSDSLNFLTNTVGGTAPFFPSVVFTHGDRMGYVTTVLDNVGNASGALYMSDIGKYQQLSADNHLIQLPGRLDVNTGISLDGAVYIFGPQWTYRTTDNGSFPVTWPTPALVDGRRGTLATRGVEVSPSGTYAWVADTTGLYLFVGAYPDLPISFEQGAAEWARINWGVAHTLQIKDYTDKKKVAVMAALDSATSPSHLLTWDYSNGKEFNRVRFSLDNINGVSMGAMEIVQNTLPTAPTAANKTKELWVGSSNAAAIYRNTSANDTGAYRDGTLGVDAQYRTSFFKPKGEEILWQHQGAHVRARGNGDLAVTAYSPDNLFNYQQPSNLALFTTPGDEAFLPLDLIGEGVCYDFAQNAVDAYFQLSAVKHYAAPWAMLA